MFAFKLSIFFLIVTLTSQLGRTALHCAAINGRLDVVEFLCEYEADIQLVDAVRQIGRAHV